MIHKEVLLLTVHASMQCNGLAMTHHKLVSFLTRSYSNVANKKLLILPLNNNLMSCVSQGNGDSATAIQWITPPLCELEHLTSLNNAPDVWVCSCLYKEEKSFTIGSFSFFLTNHNNFPESHLYTRRTSWPWSEICSNIWSEKRTPQLFRFNCQDSQDLRSTTTFNSVVFPTSKVSRSYWKNTCSSVHFRDRYGGLGHLVQYQEPVLGLQRLFEKNSLDRDSFGPGTCLLNSNPNMDLHRLPLHNMQPDPHTRDITNFASTLLITFHKISRLTEVCQWSHGQGHQLRGILTLQ